MFTNIKLQNFKSFDQLDFDLLDKANTPKKLIVIYGENGSGKSNLLSAFGFIKDLFETMENSLVIERANSELKNKYPEEFLKGYLKQYKTLNDIISIYRTCGINPDQITSASYQFVLDGKPGEYCIEFNNEAITKETLSFQMNERKAKIIDITKEKIYIKKDITSNINFYKDLVDLSKKYWGKHSFLSILFNETQIKNKEYAFLSLNESFKELVSSFLNYSCILKDDHKTLVDFFHSDTYFNSPREGYINLNEEKLLDEGLNIIKLFLSSFNKNIIDAYYKTEIEDNEISYKLFYKEKINGNVVNISNDRESTGTNELVDILFYLLNACYGETVILDECDSSIHDILFSKLICSLEPYIRGQLILSTHNTYIMDKIKNKNYIYTISSSENHQIKSVSNNVKRIAKNNSLRKMYIDGNYEEMPTIEEIDFLSLSKTIKKAVYNIYSNMNE